MMTDEEGLHFRNIEAFTDSYPWDSDMLRVLSRPIIREERPFIVYQLQIPPFSEWPTGATTSSTGARLYLGMRVTIKDQYWQQTNPERFVWPGLFLGLYPGTNDPWFASVILSTKYLRPIATDGPWTIGMGWDDAGLMRFYAHEGFVELSEDDLIGADDSPFPTYLHEVREHYLALRDAVGASISPDWIIRRVSTYADIRPTLNISRDGDSVTLDVSGFPGELYPIQKSLDLLSWEPFNGLSDSISQPQQFYRIIQ